MNIKARSESALIKNTFYAILKKPRFLVYPLLIVASAYIILAMEFGAVSYFSAVVPPGSGAIIPGSCVLGECQELVLLNVLVIAAIFLSTFLVAFLSILLGMVMFLDFGAYSSGQVRGMGACLGEALGHGKKILLLGFFYTLFVFGLYLALGLSSIPFYAPAPIPTYLIVALVGRGGGEAASSGIRRLAEYLRSAIVIFERNFLKIVLRFGALTVIPFIVYSSNLINIFISSSAPGAESFLGFLQANALQLAPELALVVLFFTITSIYTFISYQELRR